MGDAEDEMGLHESDTSDGGIDAPASDCADEDCGRERKAEKEETSGATEEKEEHTGGDESHSPMGDSDGDSYSDRKVSQRGRAVDDDVGDRRSRRQEGKLAKRIARDSLVLGSGKAVRRKNVNALAGRGVILGGVRSKYSSLYQEQMEIGKSVLLSNFGGRQLSILYRQGCERRRKKALHADAMFFLHRTHTQFCYGAIQEEDTHEKQVERCSGIVCPTVIFFAGMGESYERLGHVAYAEESYIYGYMLYGFNVLVFNYPSVGRSKGKPNLTNILAAGAAAVDYVLALGVPEHQIILHGHSLGGGIATRLAASSVDLSVTIAEWPKPGEEERAGVMERVAKEEMKANMFDTSAGSGEESENSREEGKEEEEERGGDVARALQYRYPHINVCNDRSFCSLHAAIKRLVRVPALGLICSSAIAEGMEWQMDTAAGWHVDGTTLVAAGDGRHFDVIPLATAEMMSEEGTEMAEYRQMLQRKRERARKRREPWVERSGHFWLLHHGTDEMIKEKASLRRRLCRRGAQASHCTVELDTSNLCSRGSVDFDYNTIFKNASHERPLTPQEWQLHIAHCRYAVGRLDPTSG